MGGKSKGGYDTGPMLEMSNKALDLQSNMYNDQKQMIQPWVNTGSAALDKLGMYLGLNGGSSPSSRASLIDQYRPQFTTTTQGGGGSMYLGPDGNVYDTSVKDWNILYHKNNINNGGDAGGINYAQLLDNSNLSKYGFKPVGGGGSTSTTDMDALNKYVDELMAKNAATNQNDPNYGSLLEGFSLDKFQADPGYQFRQDESKKAIERAAAARGQYFDPATVSALMERSGNLADQTYGDAYNRYNNDQNNIFNRLAAVSGIGQTATGQMVNSGQNYANQASNIYGQMGNAITASNAAKASQPSMFDTLLKGGMGVLGGWAGSGFA